MVWDISAGKIVDRRKLATPRTRNHYFGRAAPALDTVAISPSGRFVTAAIGEPPEQVLTVWDRRTGTESSTNLARGPITKMAFPSDSYLLVGLGGFGDENGRWWVVSLKSG